VKEVIIHCIDTERIFSARALGFARGETQQALSYDENVYAANSETQLRSLESIREEYEAVSHATYTLFNSFSNKVLSVKGHTPSGFCTVNGIGYTICGHTLHHVSVIKEKYL
jgi:hypothetical protein